MKRQKIKVKFNRIWIDYFTDDGGTAEYTYTEIFAKRPQDEKWRDFCIEGHVTSKRAARPIVRQVLEEDWEKWDDTLRCYLQMELEDYGLLRRIERKVRKRKQSV